ncbi:MAG: hypothetical protein J6T10_11935 [Methanobrevibacter sp.]|nr:hypothetical protein [Methanobrevibacter sp.]
MKDIICLALILVFIGGLFNLFVAAEVETSYWYEYRLPYNVQQYLAIIIFFLLFIPEGIGLYYMKKYSDKESDLRNRTTYMIEMPNGNSCEGTFYSGKNSPISVYCVDGRKFVVNGIEVKYKMIDHKRVY